MTIDKRPATGDRKTDDGGRKAKNHAKQNLALPLRRDALLEFSQIVYVPIPWWEPTILTGRSYNAQSYQDMRRTPLMSGETVLKNELVRGLFVPLSLRLCSKQQKWQLSLIVTGGSGFRTLEIYST